MRTIHLLLTTIAIFGISCGTPPVVPEDQKFDKAAVEVPGLNQGVLGYNEPIDTRDPRTNQWKEGIGVRAVASRENILAISVANRTQDSIVVGPDQFRVILPDQQYAFEKGRDDLSGFPVRELKPGESDVFTVFIPTRRVESVRDCALVFNYPPMKILHRVFIEDVVTPEEINARFEQKKQEQLEKAKSQ